MSSIQSVHTESAPAAIGPYSQAIACGEFVFCSGQVAIDPGTGELVGSDAAQEAERALTNLGAVLKAAGSDFSRVVRCTVFLTDMGDFAAINEVYARFFPSNNPPSRACVEVSALPKGAKFEIDAIAIKA